MFKYAKTSLNRLKNPLNKTHEFVSKISIDYGIIGETDRAAVVKLESFWSDVWSFNAIYELMNKRNDNAIKGGIIYTKLKE